MARLDSVNSVADIDFREWHEAGGVECLLLDVEGTLSPYGSTEVDPEIVRALDVARDSGFVAVVGLISNKTDVGFLAEVGQQVHADGIVIPLERSERKPSPTLVNRAMAAFGQTKETTGMAGDKYTADVKAAMNAELSRIALNRRLGTTDHLGDRLFRRPYEAVMCRFPLNFLLGESQELEYPLNSRFSRSWR